MANGRIQVECCVNKAAVEALAGIASCINDLTIMAVEVNSLDAKGYALAAATHMERLAAAVATTPLVNVGEIVKVSP